MTALERWTELRARRDAELVRLDAAGAKGGAVWAAAVDAWWRATSHLDRVRALDAGDWGARMVVPMAQWAAGWDVQPRAGKGRPSPRVGWRRWCGDARGEQVRLVRAERWARVLAERARGVA
jgi:hypothetical protein